MTSVSRGVNETLPLSEEEWQRRHQNMHNQSNELSKVFEP